MAIGAMTISVDLINPASKADTQAAVTALIGHVNTANANLLAALQQVRAALVAASTPHGHGHDSRGSGASYPQLVMSGTDATTAIAAVDAAIAAIP